MLKHYIASFWAQNLTTYRVLFRIAPKSKNLSPSDYSRTLTLLPRPSIHLNKSLTRLKSDLCWNIKKRVLSAKFDNVSSTFFVYHLGQKFFPPQNVLGQWHSSLDPQFIWISPWLSWKAIYVETLYSEFLRAKFDNVSSTFFVYLLIRKFFPPRTVFGHWNSSLDPQFIWISPWLGWKPIYVETLYSEFLSAKFDNV